MRSSHRYNSGGTASRRGRSRQRKQSDHANDAIHPRQASHSMSNSGVRKRLHSHQRLAIIVRLCPVQVFSFCRNITLLSLYISMYKRMGLYHRLGMVRIITKGQRRREANLIFLGATSLGFFFFFRIQLVLSYLRCRVLDDSRGTVFPFVRLNTCTDGHVTGEDYPRLHISFLPFLVLRCFGLPSSSPPPSPTWPWIFGEGSFGRMSQTDENAARVRWEGGSGMNGATETTQPGLPDRPYPAWRGTDGKLWELVSIRAGFSNDEMTDMTMIWSGKRERETRQKENKS